MRFPISGLLTLLLLAPTGQAGDKRLLTQSDILDFHWVISPQISPDGTKIVYNYVSVNAKKDGYDTSLWIVPTSGGEPRQLTSGPRDGGAQWSPDGKTIAFTRTEAAATPAEGRRPTGQIYLLSLDGGEARPLTDLPRGAGGPVWSPDGKSIAFTSATSTKDLERKDGKLDEERTDVRVILKAVYRANGGGYTQAERASHIWVVEVPAVLSAPQKARQVTSSRFTEGDPTWSKDASRLYFVSSREAEPYYKAPDSDVYAVSVNGGEPSKVASIDGPIRGLSVSPDGKRIAFVGTLNGQPIRSHSQSDLWVMPLDGTTTTPRNLTEAYDNDIAGGVGGDQHAPAGGQGGGKLVWTSDGSSIIIGTSEQGTTNLLRIDASNGKVDHFTNGNHDLLAYSASADASKIAAVISTPTNIGDVFSFDGKALKQLTHVNDKLFSQIKISEPEMIWSTSFDGKKIQSWIQRPPDYDPAKKYPLILNIHGGPHAAYGYTFDHEFQWMAAKGYIVLYPNPRGSTSYGQDFANIIQFHYPGDDYKDLMAAVDDVVARGWVDPKKMGVTGGSGGGVLTNWVIGHTDRFAAAVSQRSIANWSDFWYTADFTLFQATWFKAAPWEDEADFKARSPITYIDKIKTPLMLIEGEADFRTPPGAGGEQMFRALKYRHIPTAMIQFPGETHELSRSGKPKHRVERLEHIVAWFDKYLMGLPITTYDIGN
jgi:dipeptidyl aminopeptidase/acylaminoacyl peptidase